jgi:hypothetical protein
VDYHDEKSIGKVSNDQLCSLSALPTIENPRKVMTSNVGVSQMNPQGILKEKGIFQYLPQIKKTNVSSKQY